MNILQLWYQESILICYCLNKFICQFDEEKNNIYQNYHRTFLRIEILSEILFQPLLSRAQVNSTDYDQIEPFFM